MGAVHLSFQRPACRYCEEFVRSYKMPLARTLARSLPMTLLVLLRTRLSLQSTRKRAGQQDRRFHRSDQAKTAQGSCQEPAHGCIHHPGWDDMTACELPIIHVIADAG